MVPKELSRTTKEIGSQKKDKPLVTTLVKSYKAGRLKYWADELTPKHSNGCPSLGIL